MMDRLPRFRRKTKNPTAASPPTDATADPIAIVTASAPAVLESETASAVRGRDKMAVGGLLGAAPTPTSQPKKRSPFRGLHLKKRARSPPPAALPLSPSHAVVTHEGVVEQPHVLLQPPVSAPPAQRPTTRERNGGGARPAEEEEKAQKPSRKARIPSFLTFTVQDLESKFHDLMWAERNRIAQGAANEHDPDHKWGHFKPPDPRKGVSMDRYYNIKPWNHNRIKLSVPENELNYVNASPIMLKSPSDSAGLQRPPLRYIAMQGPTEASIDYVWRMVAEQIPPTSPVVIVQLTNMFENGMPKCFPYFPYYEIQGQPQQQPQQQQQQQQQQQAAVGGSIVTDGPWKLNEADHWNDGWRAQLRLDDTKTLAGGAIELRQMALRVESEAADRTVWHFLYKRWPDFGVPAVEDLDSFFELMRLSREYSGNDANKTKNGAGGGRNGHGAKSHNGSDTSAIYSPRIIHCSAGVGRTGTFIVLEHLMRELEAGYLEDFDADVGADEDLIFETVDALREQRRSMVQAEAQFLFVYQVLRRLWQSKYGIGEDGESGEGEPAAKRLEVEDPFVG